MNGNYLLFTLFALPESSLDGADYRYPESKPNPAAEWTDPPLKLQWYSQG